MLGLAASWALGPTRDGRADTGTTHGRADTGTTHGRADTDSTSDKGAARA
jgi:hypothetical protein